MVPCNTSEIISGNRGIILQSLLLELLFRFKMNLIAMTFPFLVIYIYPHKLNIKDRLAFIFTFSNDDYSHYKL